MNSFVVVLVCGFVFVVVGIFVSWKIASQQAGHPRGKVAGKTKEQRNNFLILLFFLLAIIIPGVYFLYRYFNDILILCPMSLVFFFFLGLTLFAFSNYRAATLIDKQGVIISVQVLENYYDTERDYFLIFQPPGTDTPHRFVVPQDMYKNISPGQTIQILYLPDKPTIIRFKNE